MRKRHPSGAWCCPLFEGLVDTAGQRGMAVFVATIAHKDAFVLQARATDAGENLRVTAPEPVTVVEDMAISHCPGCGSALHDFYAGRLDPFRREDLKIRLG